MLNIKNQTQSAMKALIDFDCIEDNCGNTIQFDLLTVQDDKGKINCTNCHKIYKFEQDFLNKLNKLRVLIIAVQDAEDILGDCNVSVVTPAGDVKIPYRLMLTRLNTLISLNLKGKKLDFNFRVEPLNDGLFK